MSLFFRGYLLGAMRGRLSAWLAIVFVAVIFGLFHASVGGLIASERVLASTCLGLVLGWIAWTTRSIFPGILLHALHNGIVVALIYVGHRLREFGLDAENEQHLPGLWIAGAAVSALVGLALIYWGREPASKIAHSVAGTDSTA